MGRQALARAPRSVTFGLVLVLVVLPGVPRAVERPGAPPSRLQVVASFSVLADMVGNVGGARVDLSTLVGANEDVHVYRPTPSDTRKVARAQVVFINGAGFEGWLERLVSASGFRGTLVTVTEGLALRPLGVLRDADPDAASGRGARAVDPHAWQHPLLGLGYVQNIERGLIRADPAGAAYYAANAESYRTSIRRTYAQLRALLERAEGGPARIIAPHDGFAYLGEAFGIEIVPLGPLAHDGEVSAAYLARVIRSVAVLGIRAVFSEPAADPRMMAQIARETGARLGGTLYSDALSAADGPAPTYLAMLRHNVETIVSALSSAPAPLQ